ELIRKIAEALAEEQGRRPRGEALGIDLLASRAADVPAQAQRQQHLMSLALDEHVLQRDLEIVEAAHGFTRVGIEDLEGSPEREPEIGAQTLRELPAEVRFLCRGRLLRATPLDVKDRRQRQLVGDERVVDGQSRRQETLADQAVSLCRLQPRDDQRHDEYAREQNLPCHGTLQGSSGLVAVEIWTSADGGARPCGGSNGLRGEIPGSGAARVAPTGIMGIA